MNFESTVFTIGYGGRSQETFLQLLRENGIRTIADIRLRPDRASMGIWVKAKTPDKGIERWLREANLNYCSIVELGNLFVDTSDWKSPYRQLIEQSGELLVKRLFELPEPLCLMCAEKLVVDCHRGTVSTFLQNRYAANIQHII